MSVQELISEILPPPARGNRPKQIAATVVRELTPADIQILNDLPKGALDSQVRPLQRLRHSHHNLARMVAEGVSGADCALITGYDPCYISTIQKDPAFKELVAHYKDQAGEISIDVLQRLRAIGIDSIDELQARLAETPNKFSSRELMELAALGFDRSGYGPSTQVNVSKTVALVDVAAIRRMKDEVAASQNGSIRKLLPPGSSPAPMGAVIDGEALAPAERIEGGEGARDTVSETGGEVSKTSLP